MEENALSAREPTRKLHFSQWRQLFIVSGIHRIYACCEGKLQLAGGCADVSGLHQSYACCELRAEFFRATPIWVSGLHQSYACCERRHKKNKGSVYMSLAFTRAMRAASQVEQSQHFTPPGLWPSPELCVLRDAEKVAKFRIVFASLAFTRAMRAASAVSACAAQSA